VRTGTVLIIVAGISALLASLALTFLVRMRSDVQESQLFLAQTQARVMLGAALSYIGETSRLGWDDPATPENEEAFGWVDVRDGSVGPRDRTGKALYQAEIDPVLGKGKHWPAIGAWTVCNSAGLWLRPPTAISPNVTPNPIQQDPSLAWKDLVGFAKASPIPVADDFAAFIKGDDHLRPGSENPCWFRIYRRKPAVFTITCGAGSSGGFRSWQEVMDAGEDQRFGTSEVWQSMRHEESLLWFEVEWNPAVNTSSSGYIYAGDRTIRPANISKPFGNDTDQPNKRNQMGTFLYIERLEKEPDIW
ncbi:MAG TPA: hypothetical protein VHX44_09260, partial [Planctomycetota bacterium]|nr:hypothetical protein [Planctomycetota bacterium]